MSERKITIGSDPEYFIRNKTNGQLVSAISFIKGDKQNPSILPSGGNIQSDNVAVEFATVPAKSTADFIANLKTTLTETMQALPDGHELAVLPSANFHPMELIDPKAQEFGCDPDFDAWELKENDSPVGPDPTFRSCGGHIHVGCLNVDGTPTHPDAQFLLDEMGKIMMVRGMDTFHGIISTILDNSPAAIERRKLYGKAGSHRYPDYGIEYRTLSNYWTKSPMLSMLMSSLVDVVVDLIIDGKLEDIIEEIGAEDIQRIINTGNVVDAKSTLNKVLINYLNEDSKFFLEECLAKLGKEDSLEKAWEIGS